MSKRELFYRYQRKIFCGSICDRKHISFEFGLSIDEKYAVLLHLDEALASHTVPYYPHGIYAQTRLHTTLENELKHEMLDSVIHALLADRIILHGDIFSDTLLMSRPESSYSNYHCILIPVTEASDKKL